MALKWLWVSLIILGLIVFGPMAIFAPIAMFFGGGYFGSYAILSLIPLLIVGMLILSLIKIFSKKDLNKKTYKSDKPIGPMKIQYLFYVVGVIFIFVSVWYFAREYIAQFPNIIKLILLLVSIVVSFIAAEFTRGSDI